MTASSSVNIPLPGPWRSLRKYTKILRVSLVERLVYRADFFVATMFRFLPLVTTFLLWESVYHGRTQNGGSATIQGYSRDNMIAYLLLVQISRMFSSMPGLATGIARDIRDGNLKKYLLQPIDMLWYLLSYRGAHKMAYIATTSLPYGILFFFCRDVFPGWPGWPTLFAYFASLLLAFVIGFFFEACIGIAGFWFLEVTSLMYILNIVTYFVSGQLFPLDLMRPAPDLVTWSPFDYFLNGLVEVLKYLPFQYLAYFPATVFLGMTDDGDILTGLALELAWAVAFVLLARWMFRRGLRRYSAFGG